MDPRERRAAAHTAVQADPAAAARVARAVTRIRTRPGWQHATRTRPATTSQAWADFEAVEACNEQERDRR